MIDSVVVTRLSRAVDPPLVSGIHNIDSIEANVVEVGAGEACGVGYTYAFSNREAESVTPLILHLAKLIEGRSAHSIRAHNEAMWTSINFVGRAGPPVMALSAIDVALWDLHAQLLGIPLHTALGLPASDHGVYAAGGSRTLDLEELVAEATGFKQQGYRGYKMRIGGADWRADVDRVAAVREALGAGVELMVDANQAWDAGVAIQVAEALGPLDIAWFEEPVDAESMAAMAAVRARSPVPVAAGETVYGSSPFHRLVDAGCLDVLQPDLMRCGGLTGFLEVADLAKRFGLRLAPHLFTQVSPHILSSSGAGSIEYLAGWFDGFFTGEPLPREGVVTPGADPGLGISISAEAQEHWTVGTYTP